MAQQAAIAAIRPGALCSDVDRIARSLIADAGFGRFLAMASDTDLALKSTNLCE